MNCCHCHELLDDDLAEKYRILDEMFWNAGEPHDYSWQDCYECNDRLSQRLKRFVRDIFDPIWWEYHSPLAGLIYKLRK